MLVFLYEFWFEKYYVIETITQPIRFKYKCSLVSVDNKNNTLSYGISQQDYAKNQSISLFILFIGVYKVRYYKYRNVYLLAVYHYRNLT